MAGASKKWATGNGPAMLGRAFAVLVFVVSTIAAAAAGCGVDSGKPPGTGGSGSSSASGLGTGGSTSSLPGDCTEGATQECHVTLAQHGSVITCYAGTQTCMNGIWGDCLGGAEFHRLLPGTGSAERREPGGAGEAIAEPEAPIFHSLSLTDAGACPDAGINDPCDPTCMGYPEVPDGGIAITGTGNPGWKGGSLSAFPGGLVNKGLKTPCFTASDCQFNEFCGNPATDPSCAHDKCAPGAPLAASCDPCVQQVCAKAANASCCTAGSCAHDLCTVGTKLSAGCDSCVATICASQSSCCTTTWDATCTALVPTLCGQSCASWAPSCVKEVHDTCGDICDPPKAACTHDICYTGDPLVNHCDDNVPGGDCVKNICAAKPSCCTTAWDATCTAMVASTCLKTCPAQGICDPWIAGQTDPSCPKADLTLGVPCFSQLPVCNVGTATAIPPPGGIIVHYWPGNSSGMPTCSPNLGNGADCPPLMQPIPPGQCVMLNCALTGNEELMVNPTGTVDECTCQNNWSLYSTSTGCEPAVCTGPQSTFVTTNVLMHIGVERSAATSAAVPASTVWGQIQTGLNAFYTNPANATTRGTLTFFPDAPPPVGAPTCDTATCTTATSCGPRVTLSFLNNGSFPFTVSSQTPSAGDAPTSAAYDGVIKTAIPLTTTNPFVGSAHMAVMILASDLNYCNTSVPAMAAAAAQALALYKIQTFVIGIGVPASTTNTIATAGGGKAFNLVANATLGVNLTAALNTIRQGVFPCSFALPPAGQFDPANPYLGYVSGLPPMLVPQTQVANAAACPPTGGYYYDNNLNPTQVVLCPNLCTTHLNTLNSAIKLVISCPTKYTAWSAPPQIYQGTCPPGTQVQWSLFGYDASALSDSSILFKVQAATTQAGLAAAPFITLGTAHSIPTDTQVCPVPKIPAQVPAPTCPPIDLFAALGGLPKARYDFLQLSMDFTPNTLSTVTPTVTDWQLTYSCPADQ